MGFKYLTVSSAAGIERLTLARSDVRNALNGGLFRVDLVGGRLADAACAS